MKSSVIFEKSQRSLGVLKVKETVVLCDLTLSNVGFPIVTKSEDKAANYKGQAKWVLAVPETPQSYILALALAVV